MTGPRRAFTRRRTHPLATDRLAPTVRLATRTCFLAIAFVLVWALPSAAREAQVALEAVARSVVAVLPEWPRGSQRPKEVEGSGVAVLDGRTIVTALHVVDKALSVQVRTHDGEVVNATVAGRDRATDLAILRIDRDLEPIGFGEDADFGEDVCALGHPFGFGLSMSCGVVSAVHKAGAGFNAIEDFVQTDAAINPGMSGGALVRRDGTLIGIISGIFTARADGNLGLNFAVAAPLARRIVDDLATSGRVRRAVSGLRLGPAVRRGETGRLAARVIGLRTGSAAEKAGIRVDDRIVEAAGRRIRKAADFMSVVGRLRPGDSLDLSIVRGDQLKQITMTLDGVPSVQ